MTRSLITSIVLLVLISEGGTQFFDFFQGFQPLIQPHSTKRPVTKHFSNEVTTRRPKTTTKRSVAISYIDGVDRIDNHAQVPKEKPKKKTTTVAPLFNVNFYTTTTKPVRKNNKNSVRNSSVEISRTTKPKNARLTGIDVGEIKYDADDERSRWYDKPIQNNNIGNDYYITSRPDYETRKPETTRRPNYATTKRQTTRKPNYNYYDSSDYYQQTTKRPYDYNYHDSNSNHQSYETPKPDYTTKGPLYNRPGVKPVVVDNRPPITNRPVTRPPFRVNPRPTDAGAIAFPNEDPSPEIIVGPNEDYMSDAEKRRYIDMAERMCDKYKSLSTKRLQAIPLIPSPQPVNVEVRSCAPTNIPLVVGGKVVEITEFPHMALLGWLKLDDAGYSWKCGGSLLSEQYVLTAAHCAYQERDNTVVAGAPRAVQLGSSYLDDPGALVVKVGAIVRHPKYKQPKSYYDIALVRLASTVTFSEVIRPACLGTPPSVDHPIIATGWGQTEFGDQSHELRSVSLPVWDITECGNVLGTSRKLPDGPSRESQMCAGERKGGKDTCQGDSGGPAQIQDGCVWRVVAVTSLGRSCGAPGTPGLYSVAQKVFIAAQIFGNLKNNRNDSQSSSTNDYNRRNQETQTNNGYNNDNYQNSNNRNENRGPNDSNRNEYTSSSNQENNKNYRSNNEGSYSNQQKYNSERYDSNANVNRNHRTDSYDSSNTYNNPKTTNTYSNYNTNARDADFDYNNQRNNQRTTNNNNNYRRDNYNDNNNYNRQHSNGRTDNYWSSSNTEHRNDDQNYNRQYYSNQGSPNYETPWWA